MTADDEIDEIAARIEELELMQDALNQLTETLELFQKPAQPVKRRAMN